MAVSQVELALPPRQADAEENDQDREARLWVVTLRHMEDAADEIGRAHVCYLLTISEGTLSRQLREVDEKKASGKLLAVLVKHQKSGRLATWLMRDYAGFLLPQRPERLTADEALREILALALAGETGNPAKEKIVAIYQRTAVKP